MLKNSIASALSAVGLEGLITPTKPLRRSAQKYAVIGVTQVPHFYGGRIRKARKLIRQIGPEAAAIHPDLQGVRVKMVQVQRLQLLDQGKYTGAKLREIRARNDAAITL